MGFGGPKTDLDLYWDVVAFGMRVRHSGSGSMHIIAIYASAAGELNTKH